MILVIACLMAATIVSTAYLSSRDNSGVIAANISDSISARWAADSGIDMSVAILETEADWRDHTLSTGGRLLNNYPAGDATITVLITDLLDGGAPNDSTENVQITSTAAVNGVQQISTANAFVPLAPGTIADVDLSEFAVFVSSSLTQNNDSLIARWPMAPLSGLGRRISIGTRATSASSIALANSGAAIDATVFHGPGASSSLISKVEGPELASTALLDQIPFPAPPSHGETYSPLTLADLTMNGGLATVMANSRYRNIELRNNAVRTIKGNFSVIADNNLSINSGAKLVVEGNVTIVVFGALTLDLGAIELKSNARLRIFVRGGSTSTAVQMSNAYIGELRSDSTRDNTGKAAWIDPQRIALFSMAPLLGPHEWRLEQNSVVKGSIYAPHVSTVAVANTSAIYGRVAATALELRDEAALFYDPALDIRCGYTNIESPVFDVDSRILAAFKTLASLDTSAMQSAADATGLTLKFDAGTRNTNLPAVPIGGEPLEPEPGEPTPRVVRVQYDMTSFGNQVKNWE